MVVVACLGNPGKKYTLTRHNFGFMAGAHFVRMHGLHREGLKFQSEWYRGQLHGQSVGVLFPHTYMNRSGEAIQRTLSFYKASILDLIVLVDDVDLPFGTLRLRAKGAGTHNGLRSVEDSLKSLQYARLRIGIGPKPSSGPLDQFVLGEFNKEEQEKLPIICENASQVLTEWIQKHPRNSTGYNRPQIE